MSRALLIRLMAALLFWQTGLAAAHCLRGLSQGNAVAICSADGVKVIHLDADGNEQPGDAPASPGGGFCPVCDGLPSVDLPAPPRLAGPAWLGGTIAWQAAGEAWPPPPARAPPYLTRAPPFLAA